MSSAAVAEEEEEYYEGEEGEGVEGEGEGEGGEDPDEILRQMDDEYAGMEEKSAEVEGKLKSASSSLDENSIYVGQVDYEASAEELMAHFSPCGAVNRVTIMRDHITGMPKGFAYIEFSDKEALNNALKLDDTLFKGRQLKILPKMKKGGTYRIYVPWDLAYGVEGGKESLCFDIELIDCAKTGTFVKPQMPGNNPGMR
jgi:polyadenylate-binding protein 2